MEHGGVPEGGRCTKLRGACPHTASASGRRAGRWAHFEDRAPEAARGKPDSTPSRARWAGGSGAPSSAWISTQPCTRCPGAGTQGAGAQGHCYSYIHNTAAARAAGLMGSQHTQAFHFLARGIRGGKHRLVLTWVTPPDTEIRKLVSFLGGLPEKVKFDKQCQKHSETTERPVSREESL